MGLAQGHLSSHGHISNLPYQSQLWNCAYVTLPSHFTATAVFLVCVFPLSDGLRAFSLKFRVLRTLLETSPSFQGNYIPHFIVSLDHR